MGLIIVLVYLAQFPLGYLHHRNRKNDKTSMRLGQAHNLITFVIIVLATVNAGVGFAFALSPNYNKVWVPLAVASFVIFAIVIGTNHMWKKTKKDAAEDEQDAKELFTLPSNYAASPPHQEDDAYAQQAGYPASNAYPQQGGYAAPVVYQPPGTHAGYSTNNGPNHQNVSLPPSY
jgi:hypothetical protein